MEGRDFAAIAERYAKEAVADKKRFGKWVRLACQRHLDDLKKKWEFEFSPDHAEDVCGFIEKLPHIEGRWDTKTITLEPAQIFMLSVIFGWRKKAGGRRFNQVYIEMARKNAKSTLTAGVVLYCFTCENEPGSQIYIGASTGDQARKVFGPAQAMVRKTPALAEAFGLQVFAHGIVCQENAAFIRPINSKSSTQDGHNPHVGVLDELHAHEDRGLYDVIRSADGARENPLLWQITTAGYNQNGVCYEQHLMVKKILERSVEMEHYFGIIYTIDENDDPFDEGVWEKANPLLGSAVKLDSLRRYAREAKVSPSSEGEFKTKRLNVWMNAASAWLNVAQWKACEAPLDWDDFDGLECYIGADLADKDDITAIGLLGIRGEDVLWKPVFWLPEAVLSDPDHAGGRGAAPYKVWADQGHLKVTPGNWVDHNIVEALIREWRERFDVRRAVFDQFSGALMMAAKLNDDEDDPFAVVLHKSAPKVTDPAKELEARVKAKRIIHDGNPVMTWMAGNVVVSRYVNGSILPKKETQMSPNKIDGIDALVNALQPVVTLQEEDPWSGGVDYL